MSEGSSVLLKPGRNQLERNRVLHCAQVRTRVRTRFRVRVRVRVKVRVRVRVRVSSS